MKPLDFLDKPEFNNQEFNNQEFNRPEFNKPLVSDQKNVCEFIDDLFGTVFLKNYYENIKKNK